MDFLVVVNAAAGSAEDDALADVRGVLAAHGEVELVPTDTPQDVAEAVARLDGRRLVVAGGDGSLHVAVQALWDADLAQTTPVALVPLGTGNDFARGVGLDLDPEGAARTAATGAPRAMDLVIGDDGTVVVNAAHAGLGAAAAVRAEPLKASLGPLAYPMGALIAGVREGGFDLRVAVDGEDVWAGALLMVGVLNGSMIGGGTPLCAPALPDDGLLDVVVASGVAPGARIAFGAALRQGVHLDREDVLHVRGRLVEMAGDAVAHDVDGEILDPTSRRSYRVAAGAWRLVT